MFEGKFYDQIDGVTMGSPLSPVQKWLETFEECEVILYHLSL